MYINYEAKLKKFNQIRFQELKKLHEDGVFLINNPCFKDPFSNQTVEEDEKIAFIKVLKEYEKGGRFISFTVFGNKENLLSKVECFLSYRKSNPLIGS